MIYQFWEQLKKEFKEGINAGITIIFLMLLALPISLISLWVWNKLLCLWFESLLICTWLQAYLVTFLLSFFGKTMIKAWGILSSFWNLFFRVIAGLPISLILWLFWNQILFPNFSFLFHMPWVYVYLYTIFVTNFEGIDFSSDK